MKGVIPAIILNTSACEIPHFFKETDAERRMKKKKKKKAERQKAAGFEKNVRISS